MIRGETGDRLLLVGVLRFQFSFVSLQLFNQIVNIPVHCRGDIAAVVVNAVVGDAVLWEVIGADFFGAVASTD